LTTIRGGLRETQLKVNSGSGRAGKNFKVPGYAVL